MVQRWLIGLGCLFLLVGVLLLAATVFRPLAAERADEAARPGEAVESGIAEPAPSPVWSAAGGLSLALGAGLIGIGMNRWRRREHRDGPASI